MKCVCFLVRTFSRGRHSELKVLPWSSAAAPVLFKMFFPLSVTRSAACRVLFHLSVELKTILCAFLCSFADVSQREPAECDRPGGFGSERGSGPERPGSYRPELHAASLRRPGPPLQQPESRADPDASHSARADPTPAADEAAERAR